MAARAAAKAKPAAPSSTTEEAPAAPATAPVSESVKAAPPAAAASEESSEAQETQSGSSEAAPTLQHAPEQSDPDAESEPTSPRFVVLAGAVVLKTAAGTEQYLYRGAAVDETAFEKASIKHARSVGLIGRPNQ